MDFDFDLFVIGAGSGGVRAARFAAGFGARVAVAEDRYLGGTCVNVGCIPKKLFLYAADYSEDIEHAKGFGWDIKQAKFDWTTLVTNKDKEIARLNGIYRNLLVNNGVQLIEGHARFVSSNEVDVGGKRYTARHVLIATGGWPKVPDIPGKEHIITSNEAFYLKQLPKRMVVVGGGYIAVEFASIFHALGVETTQMYRGDLFLRGFDLAVREHLREEMCKKDVNLRFNTDIARIERNENGSLTLHLLDGSTLETDCIFYATGREAMLDNLGLENTSVTRDGRGFIEVNDEYETKDGAVLAIGDVIGRVQLTPVALAEGMAVARRLYKPEEYHGLVDYSQIPTAVFSLPNIGTIGLTEEQAREAGHRVKIFESRFRQLKLTMTTSQEKTFMRLVVDADSDKVLGCHMVGPSAGEIVQGLAVAIRAGATKRIFDETMGIHPTAAEEFVTMRTPVAG